MKTIITLGLALTLSACNYSNTFKGTYNGAPASMSAYSKNINKYCVALSITAGNETKNSFISAQAVFDPNDFLKPMAFNTKGANCSANLEEYLVGTRNTKVLNIALVSIREQVNFDWCRFTTYNRYTYQEDIAFEVKKNTNDELVGSFVGVGGTGQYTDYDHPVQYGPIYYCGTRPGPYPGPGPWPRPWPYLN